MKRRAFLAGAATLAAAPARRIFDSHCHIIDHRFPIIENQGYTPPDFPLDAYLARARPLGVVAGAVVSGSFQGNDRTWLMDALPRLGRGWVGVTQIPNDCPDAEILRLNAIGVRAIRFNVFRGQIDSVADIVSMALVFGTDIPSTRAKRPFEPSDIDLVENVLGTELAGKAFWDNPTRLYRIDTTSGERI